MSRKTLLNVLGTLSSVLKTAENWGYICEGVNFRKLAFPERGIQEQARSFTEDQARGIIAEAHGQYRVMFAIAAMTGLRAGEILALQSSDFNLKENLLTVRRSVWRGKLSVPKTSTSQAVLPVPDALARIVREHISTRKSECVLESPRASVHCGKCRKTKGSHREAVDKVASILFPTVPNLKPATEVIQ